MEAKKGSRGSFWDELAIESYRSILKAKPNSPLVYNNLGLAYLRKGLLRKAARCFQQAIKCDAALAEAYYHLGCIHRRLGDTKSALRCFEQYHRLKRDDKHTEVVDGLVEELKAER